MKSAHKHQYIIDEKGRKRALVIDIEAYEKLIEDISDLKVIAERKTNPKVKSLAFVARLKKNGRI